MSVVYVYPDGVGGGASEGGRKKMSVSVDFQVRLSDFFSYLH